MVGAAWIASQNPFAKVMIERSAEDVGTALDRAVTRTVDADWLVPRLERAIVDGDVDGIEVLLRLADQEGVSIPNGLLADAESAVAEVTGLLACGSCAWDMGNCATLSQLAACNLALEITPVGDINALRRGVEDSLAGQPVDRVDVGLGLIGLTATGAVAASGGITAPIKAGASLLRLSRAADMMSPGLRGAVDDAVLGAIHWDNVRVAARAGTAQGALVDTTRAARIAAIAQDAARLTWNTSPADGLALMRVAGNAEELSDLVRLSDAAVDATRPGVYALGKARALRTLSRLNELALAAIAVFTLLVAQIGAVGAMLARRALRAR